eukprot:4410848-Pleurochrysis_carterae.AAC.1
MVGDEGNRRDGDARTAGVVADEESGQVLRHAQRAEPVRGGQVGTDDCEAVGVCEDEGLGADCDDAEEYAGGDEGVKARQRDGRAEGAGPDACGGNSVICVGQGRGDGLYGAFVAGAALEL